MSNIVDCELLDRELSALKLSTGHTYPCPVTEWPYGRSPTWYTHHAYEGLLSIQKNLRIKTHEGWLELLAHWQKILA